MLIYTLHRDSFIQLCMYDTYVLAGLVEERPGGDADANVLCYISVAV